MIGRPPFRACNRFGPALPWAALALALAIPAPSLAEGPGEAAVEVVAKAEDRDAETKKTVEEAAAPGSPAADPDPDRKAAEEPDEVAKGPEASKEKTGDESAGEGRDAAEPAVSEGEAAGEAAEQGDGEKKADGTETPEEDAAAPGAGEPGEAKASKQEEEEEEAWGPFEILGEAIKPGRTRRLFLDSGESLAGVPTETPVVVARGVDPGDVLCITAAIHGDEYNGIEIARRVVYDLDPDKLSGTLISVPLVNVPGFQRSSRYLPDRRDLNRFFPGNPRGSSASRLANFLFENIIRRCDYLVDLHTGSFHRTNLTQLRADATNEGVRRLAALMSPMPVLHSIPALGTLRRAAVDAGIPTVTMETGEPLRLEVEMVEDGVRTIDRLMARLGMIRPSKAIKPRPQSVFHASTWVRADRGGIFISDVELGQKVKSGEQIGSITDAINNARADVYATQKGTVLGLASNQFVMPGFAVVRIGIPAHGEIPDLPSPQEVVEPGEGELDEDGDVPEDALEEKASSVSRDRDDPDAVERPE